jgi:hypothetical protein
VQGGAQRGPDHELTACEGTVKVVSGEPSHPRPEGDRQCRPVLRLNRPDRLDSADDGEVEPVKQALPGQQGAG